MPLTISSRKFTQKVGVAKRATNIEPVFITNRGRHTHVLMSFEQYQRLTKQRRNIADALAMPGISDIEYDPRPAIIHARPADFS